MRRRHRGRPHLEQIDAVALARELEGALRTGQAGADDLDVHFYRVAGLLGCRVTGLPGCRAE